MPLSGAASRGGWPHLLNVWARALTTALPGSVSDPSRVMAAELSVASSPDPALARLTHPAESLV